MKYTDYGRYGGFRSNFEYLGEFIPSFSGVYVKKPELPSKEEIWAEASMEFNRNYPDVSLNYSLVTFESIIELCVKTNSYFAKEGSISN